ncbi:hypothetical protein VTN77DRAFT_9213 [Rasamsonia byssochlamydoides]|uniref:uncharacterized protein n=1 Tax=Rasamsonia byssochlamydoides TaxID=89139 RepID=UPI003743FB70
MFESLRPVAYGVSTVFYILSTITILLRIYSRGFIIKSFGWDDRCMTAILFFNTAQQALLYIFLHYGGGLHITLVSPKDLMILIKCLFAEEIYYIWMHFIIKTTFLLFYLRLAHKPLFTYSVYATMALNGVLTLTIWLIYCFQCTPHAAFFNPAAYPDATCLPKSITYYLVASFSILTDCIILALPIHSLMSIQASLRRRLQLITLITFGGSAVLVSFLRLIVLHQFDVDPDFTYTLGKMVIISAIELDVAIMAANAPSLKAVWLRHISKKPLTETHPLSYPNEGSRSHELSGISSSSKDHRQEPEQWRTDSEEELFQKKDGIVVTSSVGVQSHRNGTPSSDDLNWPYFEFKKDRAPI